MGFKNWLLAFRLKTLTASVVPIAAAAVLAQLKQLPWSWDWFFCLLIPALCIQIATNLFNDAIDFKKGADQVRVGPVRVTQSGLIGVRTVYSVAVVFCLIALLFGFFLVWRGGWPFVIVGLSALFLAYGYTGGPYPLAYLGLGDLFVVLYFGLIAVVGSFYILTLQIIPESFLLGLQVGLLSTVLIAINNLRDQPEDKKVGKRTLAVRFGETFVKYEIFGLIAGAYFIHTVLGFYFHNIYFFTVCVTLPLAFSILKTVFQHQQKQQLLPTLGQSALLQILFALSLLLASVV